MTEPSSQAFDAGLRALARRELTRSELAQRLERAGFDPEEAARACSQLADARYQSDERAAAERVRVLASRLQGDRAIRADLRARGIGDVEIDSALESVMPERDRAQMLAHQALDSERLGRTLYRRGYGEDAIEAALRTAATPE